MDPGAQTHLQWQFVALFVLYHCLFSIRTSFEWVSIRYWVGLLERNFIYSHLPLVSKLSHDFVSAAPMLLSLIYLFIYLFAYLLLVLPNYVNRNISVIIETRPGRAGFNSRQGQWWYLFDTATRPALRPAQSPIQCVPGLFLWE